jgi:cell wall-associated NlpC family hydrolase
MLNHGHAVSRSSLLAGDLVIYGHGFPGHHVAIYVGAGR